MRKTISVIMPVYNSGKFLNNTITSVIRQSFHDFELIVVDDGSTDNSWSILQEFAKNDSRIRVFHKENGGQSSARNFALKEAEGNYTAFVDSDDILEKDYLQYLYLLIEKYKADISICRIKHFQEGENKYDFSYSNVVRTLTSKEAISELLYQYSWLESPCNKLFKKELFEGCTFDESLIFEDSLLMPQIFEKAKTLVYGDAEKYGYIHRCGSTTTSKYSKKQLDILKVTDFLYDRYKGTSLEKAARSYKMSANIRVYLNAPDTEEYYNVLTQCEKYIKRNWNKVLFDNNVRKKTKVALFIFAIGKPIFKGIYKVKDKVTGEIRSR